MRKKYPPQFNEQRSSRTFDPVVDLNNFWLYQYKVKKEKKNEHLVPVALIL